MLLDAQSTAFFKELLIAKKFKTRITTTARSGAIRKRNRIPEPIQYKTIKP